MNRIVIVMTILCVAGFGQMLGVDSILNPGTWTDPQNVFTSNNLYASPGGNNDELRLRVVNPTDTSGTIDSVTVVLEQYVSDATKAAWNIRPYFLGVPGTTTPNQMGTETESNLTFNISADITGWSDIIDLEIGLRNSKVGGGANPEWFADYIYVRVIGTGINEYGNSTRTMEMLMPTIVRSRLCFTLTQITSTDLRADIYDITGRVLFSETLDGKAGSFTYSINGLDFLAGGVYYLVIHDIQNYCIGAGKFIVID